VQRSRVFGVGLALGGMFLLPRYRLVRQGGIDFGDDGVVGAL